MYKRTVILLFICLIFAVSGLLIGSAVIFSMGYRHDLSTSYLRLAEKAGSGQENLLNLSLSVALDPSNQNKILVAERALSLEYFTYAKAILIGIDTDEAKILLGNATLGQGDTLVARKIYTKINENSKKSFYIAKTYYLEGDINHGSEAILASLPSTDACKLYILAQPLEKNICATSLENDIALINVFNVTGTSAGYGLAYNELVKANYAQFSLALLKDGQAQGALSRDLLIELGRRHIELDKHDAALTAYKEALVKDPYYPQTYRQLILISQNIGDQALVASYGAELEAITLN